MEALVKLISTNSEAAVQQLLNNTSVDQLQAYLSDEHFVDAIISSKVLLLLSQVYQFVFLWVTSM